MYLNDNFLRISNISLVIFCTICITAKSCKSKNDVKPFSLYGAINATKIMISFETLHVYCRQLFLQYPVRFFLQFLKFSYFIRGKAREFGRRRIGTMEFLKYELCPTTVVTLYLFAGILKKLWICFHQT